MRSPASGAVTLTLLYINITASKWQKKCSFDFRVFLLLLKKDSLNIKKIVFYFFHNMKGHNLSKKATAIAK